MRFPGIPKSLHTLPLLALGAVLALAGCQEPAPPPPAPDEPPRPEPAPEPAAPEPEQAPIGALNFRVSCSDPSRAAFDRALGLLHHMMYVQARSAFEDIARDEPKCAMAHWGIATTLFQPLWPTRPGEDERLRGWEAIQRAGELEPASERERMLVAATEAFFRQPREAEWRTRIERWAEAMEAAWRAHPDDPDTAAFYGLSRLALAVHAEDRHPLHEEAAQVLREVYAAEPAHPGAIHYVIHANDADGRAGQDLDIVRSYGEIAPDTPHALHMPSHIYVRLGKWPEVIEWNRRSADAALRHPAGEAVSHHYPHAQDYLLYAHLQRGEDDQALDVLQETFAREDWQRSFISAFHAATIPARYAVERRNWREAAALAPRTPAYLPWDEALWAEGLTWFARGLGAVHTFDEESAREAEQRLASLRDAAEAAGESGFATYIEVDRLILAGRLAHADHRPDEAVDLLRRAGELESSIEKHPVTPGALAPPYEALGDLLMDLNRPDEALEAYRVSDEIWPGRYNTLLGAARAADRAGREDTALDYYGRLLETAGDSDRPGVVEARTRLDAETT